MNRAFALLALLLMAVPAMPVQATHDAPAVGSPQAPQVDEDPVAETGIHPVDESQRDAARSANAAARSLQPLLDGPAQAAAAAGQAVPAGRIEFLFDDQAGHRHGGVGDWSELGGAWEHRGDVRMTGGDGAGRYGAGLDDLLVLPELDLRTGLADAGTGTDPPRADLLGLAARAVFQHLNYLGNSECVAGVNAVRCFPWLGSARQTDTDPQDGAFTLRFEHRQNLAAGRDGVQVLVFTEPPTTALRDACRQSLDQRASAVEGARANGQLVVEAGQVRDEPCTVVQTLARSERPVTTARSRDSSAGPDGEPAFTGYSEWTTDAVDLGKWAGRSVWVAFRLVTGNVPGPSYFLSPVLFDTHAGFYGFQLGNVSMTGLAPARSLRMRPPVEPSFVALGRAAPTVAVGAPIHYASDVLNLGTNPINGSYTLELESQDTGAVLASLWLGDLRLAPGETHRFDATLTNVTPREGSYLLTLRADAVSDAVGPDADPTDDAARVAIDVKDVAAVVAGDVTRSVPTFAQGDLMTFRLPLTNRGTVAATVVANAQVINAATRAPTGVLPIQGGADRTVVLPAGQAREANWTVEALQPGQYHLFVRVGDTRPFDATADLLPLGQRSHPVLPWSATPPTIDGTLQEDEWPTMRPVEFGDLYAGNARENGRGTFVAMANATTLWVAATAVNAANSNDQIHLLTLNRTGTVRTAPYGNWTVRETASAPTMVLEAAVPLADLKKEGLPGLLLEFLDNGKSKRFPPAALAAGEGLARNGTLGDEAGSWLRVDLSPLGHGGLSVRRLSPGFGVDRTPPPLLDLDLSDCGGLAGWSQTGMKALKQPATAREKWTCAPYGADGKVRLYEGRTDGCRMSLCAPISGFFGETVALAGDGETGTWRDDYNMLVSPAFEIGSARDPHLVLRHQYASQVEINDRAQTVRAPGTSIAPEIVPNEVNVYNAARVYVQAWDDAQGWGAPVLVRPEGGYSTEATNGVRTLAHPDHDVTAPTSDERSRGPGWWWPQGEHAYAQAPGDPIPLGRTFGGSPWVVDRLPLFGFEHGADGAQALFLENRTVRLLFEWLPSDLRQADGSQALEYGWRIEGLAVTEGERFARDVALAGLVVQPGTDAAALGLGPGTQVRVNVTVVNQGAEPVPGGTVCAGMALVDAPGAAAFDPCAPGPGIASASGPLPGPLLAGASRNVTLLMDAPPQAGPEVRFAAAVQPVGGDDFPSDNLLRGDALYPVRSNPDLAIEAGTAKPVGARGASFPFQAVLHNQGNLPLGPFTVTRRFVAQSGEQVGQDIGTAQVWQVAGPLQPGERRRVQDLVPSLGFANLTFPAPLESGEFAIVLATGIPGDIDPADDVASVRVRAVDTLQSQPFTSAADAARLRFDGTPGVWRLEGGALVAGGEGELPDQADAYAVLTGDGPIDLTPATGATLTLRHRFDLEAAPSAGFDAARVEVSTDGVAWRPLRPNPAPLQGLPDGYSPLPILGQGALAGGAGTAFTGRSAELPDSAPGGWIETTFDLGRDPAFSRPAFVEAFDLHGLASQADAAGLAAADGTVVRVGEGWVLDEPGAFAGHRMWSTQNLTGTAPAWHVEETEVPGVGQTLAWRFGHASGPGYPDGADERLITPVVDLDGAGSALRLEFDHQYGFEAKQQCDSSQSPLPSECFRSALDGGAIEYQVLDAATGRFGPWRQLTAAPGSLPAVTNLDDSSPHVASNCDGPGDEKEQGWTSNRRCHDHRRKAERRLSVLEDAAEWEAKLAASGYSAVADRTPTLAVEHSLQGLPTGIRQEPQSRAWTFEERTAYLSALFTTGRHCINNPCESGSGYHDDVDSPYIPSSVSYVLSGTSEGVDGWSHASWDLSPLAGQQVRFAFHAATDDGTTFTDMLGPRPGWSVANLAVASTRFVGAPAHLRLHLATDESLGQGSWSIDSATVVGALTRRNAAILADPDQPSRVPQGAEATLAGRIRATGQEPLGGLLLGVTAIDVQAQRRLDDGTVVVSVPGATPAAPALQADQHALLRLPTLTAAGAGVPVAVRLAMPEDPSKVEVRLSLLQPVGGELRPARLDDPGNTVATWTLSGADLASGRFLPDGSSEVRLQPGAPHAGQPVTAFARLANDGTLPLDDVTVTWTMAEVLHKGGPGQDHVGAPKTGAVATSAQAIGRLALGDRNGTSATFVPPRPGLYRFTASATSGGDAVASAMTEVLVDRATLLMDADFAAGDAGFVDASDPVDPDRGGGSPDELRWRLADGGLLWGVNTSAQQGGMTYCSYGSCVFPAATSSGGSTSTPPAPPPVTGLEGRALGPPLDLRLLPMGQGVLTLRHDHLFEAQDGAQVELVPFRHPFDPQAPVPVGKCAAGPSGQDRGRPMGFVLVPEPASDYGEVLRSAPSQPFPGATRGNGGTVPGQTTPERHNALVPSLQHVAQAFGGQGDLRTTRFRLDQLAVASCLDAQGQRPSLVLANYVVVPVLHVGTLPGHDATLAPQGRAGAKGWRVESMQASVADLAVPVEPLSWSVQPGSTKTFVVEVTNPSLAEVTVTLRLGAGHQLPDPGWVALPEPAPLGAGETLRLPVRVAAPRGGAAPGVYAMPLVASLAGADGLDRPVQVRLEVRDAALADVAVRLTADPEARFVAGTIEPLHLTFTNLGQARSLPTSARVRAQDAQGTWTDVGLVPVAALCPAPDPTQPSCTGSDTSSAGVSWPVPLVPGAVRLLAELDDAAARLDQSAANNRDSLDVTVRPQQFTDLVVTLRLEGVDDRGQAEAGRLVAINATVANNGTMDASDVRFSLRIGSTTAESRNLGVLAPGARRSLLATWEAAEGDVTVSALAIASRAELEANIQDDEAQRLVRVRGHDVHLVAPAARLGLTPGKPQLLQLAVRNDGSATDSVLVGLAPGQPGWSLLAFANPVRVGPDQETPVTLQVTAPTGLPAGNLSLLLTAMPVGKPARLQTTAVPVLVPERPGVPRLDAVAGQPVRPGSDETLRVVLHSASNAPQRLGVRLADGEAVEVVLPAQQPLALNLTLRVPAGTPVGNLSLPLRVTAANGTTLVATQAVVRVLAAPSLRAAWLAPVRAATEAGARTLWFPLQVSNDGNVAVGAAAFLEDLAGNVSDEARSGPLAPGATTVLNLSVQRAATDPDHWDGRAVLTLVDGGEASVVARMPVPGLEARPMLRVDRVETMRVGGVRAGEPVALAFDVVNGGEVVAPPGRLLAWLNGEVLEVLDVPELAPGQRHRAQTNWTFEAAGDFVVGATVDRTAGGDGDAQAIELHVDQAAWSARVRDAPSPGVALLALALAIAFLSRRRRA